MNIKILKRLPRNNRYLISEYGEIYSLYHKKYLTPKRNHDGYLRIQLYDHGHCEFVSVHRLVAETYIDNPGNKPFVNHINGNKSDNRVENLEWCTQKENIAHAWTTGLSHRPLNTCGKRYAQYSKEGCLIKEFPSTMEIERTLGIKHTNISSAAKRNGTAGGYIWKEVMP